jgi:hypothetical protein
VDPRKAAAPQGRVEGAGACLEAGAFLAAGQTVPRLVRATDRSLDYFLDRGTPGAGVLLPVSAQAPCQTRTASLAVRPIAPPATTSALPAP